MLSEITALNVFPFRSTKENTHTELIAPLIWLPRAALSKSDSAQLYGAVSCANGEFVCDGCHY